MALAAEPGQVLQVRHLDGLLLPVDVLAHQLAGKEGVHPVAGMDVVLMARHLEVGLDLILRAVEAVHLTDDGLLDGLLIAGPVAGGTSQEQRQGREHAAHLAVLGVAAQTGGVLALTAALHLQGDHVDGRSGLDAVVHQGQRQGLGAAAGAAGHADTLSVHLGHVAQHIQGADVVPQLHAQAVGLPQILLLAAVIVADLLAVHLADHVRHEAHKAQTGEVRQLLRHVDLAFLAGQALILKMAHAVQDRRVLAGDGIGQVQIAGRPEAGEGLVHDLVHGIALFMPDQLGAGVQGRLFRPGIQSGGHPQAEDDLLAALIDLLLGGEAAGGHADIGVPGGRQAPVQGRMRENHIFVFHKTTSTND